jgi:hypothetical protein
MQKMISSLLAKLQHGQTQNTLPNGSVQYTPENRDGGEGSAGDDSDDDSRSTSDNDGDGDGGSACDASDFTTVTPKGTKHRSIQCRKWAKEEYRQATEKFGQGIRPLDYM